MASLLELEDLHVHFDRRRGRLRAVDGVSLHIAAGETVGLVGESGCGKSTLGKAIVGLVPVTQGRIRLQGMDTTHTPRARRKPLTRIVQIVFQDPVAALNPRKRIERIVGEPLSVHGIGAASERRERVRELLARVGLSADAMDRLPHEFSGGQRQRIGIARALALAPKLLICDEPVSALDLSIQAQILNLFADLRAELGLAYLFISHDLAVVRHVAQRVAVMYLGRIVESGPTEVLFARAGHPYTQALIAAAPSIEQSLPAAMALEGDPPSPFSLPTGCRFHPRCPRASERCRIEDPVLTARGDDRVSACHHDGD